MPYKDKVKDRQWHREHMQRKRTGVTAGVTNVSSVTPSKPESVTPNVIPEQPKPSSAKPPGMGDNEWAYRQMKAEG